MSGSNKSLLSDIIQARENIKRKYNALKQGKFESETMMNNTFSSIIDPLNKIQQHLKPLSETEFSASYNTAFTSSKKNENENENFNSVDVYNAFKLQSSAGLDKVYGPRKLHNGDIVLGRKKIKFTENELLIECVDNGSVTYPLTSGLVSLLFVKAPNKYTESDLNMYKEILNKTSVHKTKYGRVIKMSKGKKYELISNLFSSVGGGSRVKDIINMRLQKTQSLVYWNDANELVDRLRLLYSSLAAGNTAVRNEIITICEELVEAKLLKYIPNV